MAMPECEGFRPNMFRQCSLELTCKIHAKSRDFRSPSHIVVETSGLGASVYSQSTPMRQSPEKLILEEWIAGETPEVFQNTKTLTHLWKMSLTSPAVLQNVFAVRVFLENDF